MISTFRNRTLYYDGRYTVRAERQADGEIVLVSQPNKTYSWRIRDGKAEQKFGDAWGPNTAGLGLDCLQEVMGTIEVS